MDVSRIVLATAGSLGDFHPYLAVGAGLKARGHEVTIASDRTYRTRVEAAGLCFRAMRPSLAPSECPPEVLRRANDLKTGSAYLVREMVLPYIAEMYADLLEACAGADLLVIHTLLYAAPSVAEKLKIPWISVMLAPGSFSSAWDPPILPPLAWLHGLRRFGPLPNDYLLRFCRRVARSWMTPLDRLRASEGLPPLRDNPIQMFSPWGTAGWYSPLLGGPQPDWPPHTSLTGFPFREGSATGSASPELLDYLEQGDRPVVFTLGSAAVRNPGSFYEESLRAVERLGCRAVFLTGSTANRPKPSGRANVFVADYAEFSVLFPRSAAVVHQGGIGTIAETMRAGVPMLVVPFMHDQPDNAFRASRVGIARVVPRAKYNAERAARNLHLLLSQSGYAAKAREAASQIATEDGLNRACAVLEQHARGS